MPLNSPPIALPPLPQKVWNRQLCQINSRATSRSSHGDDNLATALPHVACAHLCLPPGVDDGAPPLAHHLGSPVISLKRQIWGHCYAQSTLVCEMIRRQSSRSQ